MWPPNVGGAYLLPQLVGLQRAKELRWLTTEIDAEHAHRLGLVNAVIPNHEAVLTHAVDVGQQLAGGSRFAIAHTKRLVNASTAGTFQCAVELEAAVQVGVLRTGSARQRFRAFLTTT